MKVIELELEGLNCAGCAAKIEKFSNEIEGVSSAQLDFVTKKLKINIINDNDEDDIKGNIKKFVKKVEPEVKVLDINANHAHSHEHNHDHGKADKKDIIRIGISLILFIIPNLLKLEGNIRFITYLLSYLIVGYDVIIRAIKNVAAGIQFDENFLMTLATFGAFIIGEYPEGVAVMLFYQVGEMFQGMAVNHSRKSITALLDIKPDYANLIAEDEITVVNPTDVAIGDYILIKPGEKVPLDGIVVEGESTIDTSNITGESVPRNIREGDHIISGVVNNHGLLKVQVEKEFGESTVSKILDLVENASGKKAPTENFITKFASIYTPVVVFSALIIGILPPILAFGDLRDWAYRAFIFLVISCPCALVISIPLGFFGGIGGASKSGILIKGGNYLEALNDVETIVFDKTGTITKGTFKVTKIFNYDDYSKEEVLELAAYGEAFSNHPIGKSIVESYDKEIQREYIKDYKEISGKGIEAKIDGNTILLGNKDLLVGNGVEIEEVDSIGTTVYISEGNKHIGTIIVSDELKENTAEDIGRLKKLGIKETIMLSGDNQETAEKVGKLAGLDKVYGDLLPQDKVNAFEDILSKKTNSKVIFVGDGVNDAPVLARADIGIAMGALGSDAAIEASDIVIMTDEIGKIATAIKIAKNTKKIVTQNIILALAIKLIVLVLGAFGIATMWAAVFADVGVSIIAILNSIRALKVEK
ncbi:heavy metal translocating P-type ATPase [Paratissierella segnis]|uniref:Cd(2+)-exporting ATPase n=1 Tax=Paratissierella segnis TaxID=2763679 RepID=A0A926IKM3_9FIRM|nr:heavy metal translocating P-type ATPase [Paratissierella segnis]MBC8589214.1 cadmium-translocating P-type ATPase [Paratissierella segnis]